MNRHLDAILDSASCCEAVELSLRESETSSTYWNGGQLVGRRSFTDCDSSLRVIADGNLGTVVRHSAGDWSGLWSGLVEEAVSAARLGPQAHRQLFAGPTTSGLRVPAVRPETAEQLGVHAHQGTKGLEGFTLTASVTTTKTLVLTSEGARAETMSVRYECKGRIRRGGGAWSAVWMGGCPDHGGGPSILTASLCRVPDGSSPASVEGIELVVLMPSAVSRILETVVMAFDGLRVVEGLSPMSRWLGLKAIHPRLTIAVDRCCPGGPFTAPIDDQGVPTRTQILVRDGVICGFFGTLLEADSLEACAPGFGTRPLGGELMPHPGQILVSPGPDDEQALLSMGDCLVVAEMDGRMAETGDFSMMVLRGDVYRRGELQGPAGPVLLRGNAYRALNQVVGVSCSSQWVFGQHLLPAVAVEGLAVITGS